MDRLKGIITGKRTYIVAVLVIVIGVAEWAGVDVPGVVVGPDPLGWILSGLGLGALRLGIANKGK